MRSKKIKLRITVNQAIRLLIAFLFIINMSEGLFAPVFAVYVTNSLAGATLKTVGFAVAVFALMKSLVQVPLARWLDRRAGEDDDFYAILLGSFIGIIHSLGLIFITQHWHLYVIAAINGIGSACLMAAYYAVFSHHIDKNSEGFEWSLMSVWGLTLSTALGGAAGGVLADTFGFRITFFLAALFYLAAIGLLIMLYPQLKSFRKKPFLSLS